MLEIWQQSAAEGLGLRLGYSYYLIMNLARGEVKLPRSVQLPIIISPSEGLSAIKARHTITAQHPCIIVMNIIIFDHTNLEGVGPVFDLP